MFFQGSRLSVGWWLYGNFEHVRILVNIHQPLPRIYSFLLVWSLGPSAEQSVSWALRKLKILFTFFHPPLFFLANTVVVNETHQENRVSFDGKRRLSAEDRDAIALREPVAKKKKKNPLRDSNASDTASSEYVKWVLLAFYSKVKLTVFYDS